MKTAVEYLVEQLMPKALTAEQYHHIEQAKEIFKQQLNEAMNYDRPLLSCWEDNSAFEEYYNETFKKD
jgi:hypothetical protein